MKTKLIAVRVKVITEGSKKGVKADENEPYAKLINVARGESDAVRMGDRGGKERERETEN